MNGVETGRAVVTAEIDLAIHSRVAVPMQLEMWSAAAGTY